MMNILREVEFELTKEKPMSYWYEYFETTRYKFNPTMQGVRDTDESKVLYKEVLRKAFRIMNATKKGENAIIKAKRNLEK